jgi:hypothetical protein
MILVSINIFNGFRIFKEALLDAISILNFGTVVSEYRPLQNPQKKSPVVFTLSKLEAAAGIIPKKFLKEAF